MLGRQHGTSERVAGQEFAQGQRSAELGFNAFQNQLNRDAAASENKKARRDAITGDIIGAAGTVGGALAAANPLLGAGVALAPIAATALAPVAKSIGKTFKKLCFEADTLIEMANGSTKPIKMLELDDLTRGGKVQSIRFAKSDDVYRYFNILVTGSHAVREDMWRRVKNSEHSTKALGTFTVVSIITSDHRVFSYGQEFADEAEWGDDGLWSDREMNESLQRLNEQEVTV